MMPKTAFHCICTLFTKACMPRTSDSTRSQPAALMVVLLQAAFHHGTFWLRQACL